MSEKNLGEFIFSEKKSARSKMPKYCEHGGHGGEPNRKMKLYRKKNYDNRGIVAEPRCKGKPYKLCEVVSHHPPGNANNPYPEASGKWVRSRVWNWFCEDCYLGWHHGVYVVSCPKCKGKFYYSYDDVNGDMNHRAAEGDLSCPYCKAQLFKWKKVGDRRRKYRRTKKGWRATNEWWVEVFVPKGPLTCKKCKRKMPEVKDIKRSEKNGKVWKVEGWRCPKCGLEVPRDEA
jgi:uncharacterized protein YbaR (Trm112 family)